MKKAVLLLQLGSPDQPTPPAVRSYLKEFLSDPRVMDMGAFARAMILNLFILPKRPQKVAPKYQGIWTEEGSPLTVESKRVQKKLQEAMGEGWTVELAMRYGNPSMPEVLARMEKARYQEITVLPLFPQYASATTGSALERFLEIVGKWQSIPKLEILSSFYDHPALSAAWANRARPYLEGNWDHVLFSFHGLPESQIHKANPHCLKESCCEKIHPGNHDCYRAQCFAHARLIAEKLGIDEERYSVGFQSRLGKAKWIEPYTSEVVQELAERGIKRLVAFSPSFVADCLETIEEIGEEERENFLEHGGEELLLVPSLNSGDDFIEALKSLIEEA